MLSPSEKAERSKKLFAALRWHVNVAPTSKGEVWIACPACGTPAKTRHFSFSERGAHCHKCGHSPSLTALAAALGLPDNRPYSAPRMVEAPKAAPKPWQKRALELALSWTQTPGCRPAWDTYKRLSPETHFVHMLGLGVLPERVCLHRRLIVPIFKSGQVVGFRARRFECQCDPKWDSPPGAEMWLYNAEAIVPGQPVTVVENPIDALMIGERIGEVAVATLGVSIWKEEYYELVRPASDVTIAFDNDVAGNLRAPAAIAAYQAAHAGRMPTLGGPMLYNKLKDHGFRNVDLYDWSGYPEGADWGEVLK